MRELKYAILGLVSRGPVSGYDITKHFNDSLSKFWEANHSQIYPELKRLVDEGMVEYKVTIQGEKLEKKLYTITPLGHEELMDWLFTDEPLGPIPKDTFRLRLYFCENLSQAEVNTVINGQYTRRLKRLKSLEMTLESVGGIPEIHSPVLGDRLLVKGGILRERAYIEWLHECAEVFGVALY